jgi:hypothetical protein
LSGVYPGMIMTGIFILTVYIRATGCLMQFSLLFSISILLLLQLIVFIVFLYTTLTHYG